MAIVQKNTFVVGPPAQNLTNMGLNVDANRLNDDKTFITVDFSGSPAEVTIEIGSVIEVNGNLYTIESADEVITMDNATDNYIIFDGTTFSTAPTIGTWSTAKQGYYQADNVSRTLKWFVDQTNEYWYINILSGRLSCKNRVYLNTTMSGLAATTWHTVQFDSYTIGEQSYYNTGTYQYTAPETGLYRVNTILSVNQGASDSICYIRVNKNSGTIVAEQRYKHSSTLAESLSFIDTIIPLNATDTIEIQSQMASQIYAIQSFFNNGRDTSLIVEKIG